MNVITPGWIVALPSGAQAPAGDTPADSAITSALRSASRTPQRGGQAGRRRCFIGGLLGIC